MPDAIDEIIAKLDPEEVPTEFIVMAKIVTLDGEERFITGPELEQVMENPERHNVVEARIILNVRKIREAIIGETESIFEQVHAKI